MAGTAIRARISDRTGSVSYTHLDVYKRQTFRNVRINGRLVTDLASGNIQANEFVDDVRFVAG